MIRVILLLIPLVTAEAAGSNENMASITEVVTDRNEKSIVRI